MGESHFLCLRKLFMLKREVREHLISLSLISISLSRTHTHPPHIYIYIYIYQIRRCH
ncbi:hypothetical protein OAV88_04170 [bacterium]|nr:hypothetical protein [bacterium]